MSFFQFVTYKSPPLIKRKGASPPDHVDPMTALLSYLSKGENPAFFLCRTALPPHTGNSYCPYTGKPPQAVSSPILNPNSCVFWNGGKDSTGRTLLLSGNSACRDGRSLCRACYTDACRSRPGRTPIPDAISCSGS